MNELMFRIENRGATAVTVCVYMRDCVLNQETPSSDLFSVAANSFTLVPIVIGGYQALEGLVDLNYILNNSRWLVIA